VTFVLKFVWGSLTRHMHVCKTCKYRIHSKCLAQATDQSSCGTGKHWKKLVHEKTGFEGIPVQYQVMLDNSGIKSDEILENPDAVAGVLQFMIEYSTTNLLTPHSEPDTPDPIVPHPTQNAEFSTIKAMPVVSSPQKIGTDYSDKRQSLSNMGNVIQHPELLAVLAEVYNIEDPMDIYENFCMIGKGAGGEVHVATNKVTGEKMAIKKITITKLNQKIIANEIKTLHELKHDNIMSLKACYIVGKQVWMVMEYLGNGSLADLIHMATLNESEIAYVCKQVLQGMYYMHSIGRMHRDIKSENIMFSYCGKVVLVDMGTAAQLTAQNPQRTTVIGTPYWMAPELVLGNLYDYKVDVWALGIVIREMIEGEPPFSDQPPMRTLYLLTTQDPPPMKDPSKWSSACLDFLDKCLQRNPDARYTSEMLLQHPFLQQACSTVHFLALIHKSIETHLQ